MCPALMFAARRNDSVNGRTRMLVVSIRIKNGFSQSGAPSGRRCATDAFGFLQYDEIINDIHSGSPKASVKIRCLVKLNVYGFKPIKLIKIIDENNTEIMDIDPFKEFLYVRDSWLNIIKFVENSEEMMRLLSDQYCI